MKSKYEVKTLSVLYLLSARHKETWEGFRSSLRMRVSRCSLSFSSPSTEPQGLPHLQGQLSLPPHVCFLTITVDNCH